MASRAVDVATRYSALAYASNPPLFKDIEDADVVPVPAVDPPTRRVALERYLPDKRLVDAVDLAIALGRPLLLQGEPGAGKTRLAYHVRYALGLPLEVSYIKSTTRAQDLLYTYDAISRLYDAQLPARASSAAARERSSDIRNYVRLGPLGRSIARAAYGRRSVVLIDEIDKADLDFPNDLLWELDRLEFSVAEAPDLTYRVGDTPDLRPIVFVTHNEEKSLPSAFLRRCIFHYIDFPGEARLLEILECQQLRNEQLGHKAVEVISRLRELDLSKRPGLSELLDWVGYLEAVKAPPDSLDELPHLGVLLKLRRDQERAREALAGG